MSQSSHFIVETFHIFRPESNILMNIDRLFSHVFSYNIIYRKIDSIHDIKLSSEWILEDVRIAYDFFDRDDMII